MYAWLSLESDESVFETGLGVWLGHGDGGASDRGLDGAGVEVGLGARVLDGQGSRTEWGSRCLD